MKVKSESKPLAHQPNTTIGDVSRRTVLKGIVVSGTAALVPAMGSAMCMRDSSVVSAQTNLADNALVPCGYVSVEFSDAESNFVDGDLARVTITNHGEEAIELQRLSPATISTEAGVYDLDAALAGSPVQLGAGAVQHLWLQPSLHTGSARAAGQAQMPDSVFASLQSGRRQGMVPLTVVRGEARATDSQLARAVFA